MESELWPEHIIQASRRGVPIALINGRISNRSFSRYQRLPSLARRLLTPFHAILAASARDADRFLALGADPAKVKSTGNLKLDVAINPILTPDQITRLKADLGFSPRSEAETLSLSKGSPPPPISRSPDPSLPTSPLTLSSHSPPLTPASLPTVHCSLFTSPSPLVILGASTWPGEEAALVSLLHAALDAGIDCRLLLVPRHAERSAEIEAALADTNLPVHFRSQGIPAPAPVMIYVGDTTGELATLAQTADLVFIGKSLPPHTGGQTPIEAAALGKPILFGPGMGNFREISDALLAAGVAREVANIADLTSEALSLLLDPAARAAMAAATRQWHTASQGAARRTCAAIKALL